MAYATTADLQAYLGLSVLPDAARLLLERASRDVDDALVCAMYDSGDDGMPTDPPIAAALRDATLEQVAWWLALGDDEGLGVASVFAAISIGSVSMSGRAGGGGPGVLGDQARKILQGAGLLGYGPWAW